ncbi:MAG: S1C family serine protease, partial [Solirubrobacteraceae bacterium]
MKSLKVILPVLCGAVAGAIVALVISQGSATKTVTDTVAASGESVPLALSKPSGMSINAIYRQDSPGVVDIDVTATSSGGNDFPFSQGSQTTQDEGAGVVLDKQGDIITDEHVVAGATSVTVHFQDGFSARAKVLGTDPNTDVGVIKVNVPSSELHPIPFADSGDAQVGDPVVAIGSPFGLPETVTAGIVSAVGRSIPAPNGYTISGAIQTDAAINPGNSGGPLLDANGAVLGLNDQIQTNSGQSAGVGFATPANMDRQVANDVIEGKAVRHTYLGVCLDDVATDSGAEIATRAGGASCQASPVVAGSPAAKAGLRPGDVITAIDGKKIPNSNALISDIATYQPGETVTLSVHKAGASGSSQVKVTLGD